MTRVIAGTAGGRTLRTPPGSGTRPTSERVREAVFSALDAREAVRGARVLDLYAGSGALGLEAASRGAASVVLVESDRRAADVAAANAVALGLSGTRVVRTSVTAHLRTVPTAGEQADLVFVDPPYDLPAEALDAVLADLADGWLAPGAVVVVERSTRTRAPLWPDGIHPRKPKKYGETTIHLATST